MTHPVSPLARPFPDMPPIPGVTLRVVRAGYKDWGRCDLTYVELAEGTAVAGVFTRNVCCSSEVELGRANVAQGQARALVVNAGNSNAFTGYRGREAVEQIMGQVAAHLGCGPDQVFVSSTGVIGVPLPKDKAARGSKRRWSPSPAPGRTPPIPSAPPTPLPRAPWPGRTRWLSRHHGPEAATGPRCGTGGSGRYPTTPAAPGFPRTRPQSPARVRPGRHPVAPGPGSAHRPACPPRRAEPRTPHPTTADRPADRARTAPPPSHRPCAGPVPATGRIRPAKRALRQPAHRDAAPRHPAAPRPSREAASAPRATGHRPPTRPCCHRAPAITDCP